MASENGFEDEANTQNRSRFETETNEQKRNPAWLKAEAKETPLWMRTVYASIPIAAVFVLHGQVHDLQPIQVDGVLMPDTTYMALHHIFKESGFDVLLQFDPIRGLRIDVLNQKYQDRDVRKILESAIGGAVVSDLMQSASDRAAQLQTNPYGLDNVYSGVDALEEAVALEKSMNMALVIDYTSQMREQNQAQDPTLRQAMLACLSIANAHALYNKKPVRFQCNAREGFIRHPIIWLIDKPDDLPVWLSNGDGVRTIPVPFPDIDTREQMAKLLLKHEVEEKEFNDACKRFADATEGFSLRGMFETTRLAQSNGNKLTEIEKSVRTYREGLSENPWQSPRLREALATGEEILKRRVQGQDAALRRVLDILKRSALGLTGAHARKRTSQPRGVLYFAGPTGVGKTEMAKAIAELVFADEQALIRFDMSEFQDEHAKIRLVGAPPSYVGFGAGGELTNAVQERPHSIILFDEMDKAGRQVNDLFLQILSDGRLTDGSGRTVSFSECLIIFTSNQGIITASKSLANLDMDNPDESSQYDQIVKSAVEKHFREDLGRPELLGRLGDNIVVFHPMHGEVAQNLVKNFIEIILSNVRIRVGNSVVLSQSARNTIMRLCTQPEVLANGGRGITTCLEEHLVNPLGRLLFDVDPSQKILVEEIYTDNLERPSLRLG
jgi:ATP-dependent Clp protease ATP-binding subunit ClpB